MKIVGIIVFIVGLIGLVFYGMQALSNSETLNIFGLQIAVSSANWTPVIVSSIVMIAGVAINVTARKA